MIKISIITFSVGLFICSFVGAQDFSKAHDYLTFIGDQYQKISKESWDYTRAIGHGKRDKLIEKRRGELSQTILDSKRAISKLPAFNKSTALRDSIVSYLKIDYIMVNKDYAKLVDMKEVAEQSYDAMEAYMLARDLANEKQAQAHDMVSDQFDRFYADNNIHVNKSGGEESKLSRKIRIAGEVFDYYDKVYLLFFKSNKQNSYLVDAINKGDVNSIEQNRNSLLNYSVEGLEKLKEYPHFKGDKTLNEACRQMLEFYADKAKTKVPQMIEHFTTKDKFDKIKTTFDQIKPAQRTQGNIDTYNNAVNEINASSAKFNETVKKMNDAGNKLLNNWNTKSDAFLDNHIP